MIVRTHRTDPCTHDPKTRMGGTAGQRRAEKAERENAKAAAAASSKKQAEDDAYWAAAGDGAKSKAAARREASDAAADEAAAKRAEAKRLAKLEEEEMANMGKPKNAAPKKMTRAELEAYKNMSAKDRLKMKFAAQKAAARTVDEDEYSSMVDVKNENKTDKIDASGIDAAVDAMGALGVGGAAPVLTTNHKAAFKAFEERELPRLKEERPGLKMSQYNEALSKMWKKDPTNPANFAPPGK